MLPDFRTPFIPTEGWASAETLRVLRVNDLPPEGYRLTITPEGITAEVADDRAIIHAKTTLQLLADEQGHVPCGKAEDAPALAHRGLLLDCVRHFFPLEEVKAILEAMRLCKMNVLHLPLCNDQGWRMACRAFPKLHEQCGNEWYSQEELCELVEFAAERGIDILPEIDMPGHMTALLAAYPEYGCFGKRVQLAKTGGIYPVILCAGQEKVYHLIGTLLDEVCAIFPSKRIHIGGDEAPKSEWKQCPHCQALMRREGLKDETALQGYFLNRVIAMLHERGREAICWNEALMGGSLDPSATVQYWTVDQAESAKAFVQRGGKLIYSDMFTCYLDYPAFMTSVERVLTDEIVLDDLPVPLKSLAGMEVCLWTEHIADRKTLERHLFPRLYALAERAWTGHGTLANFLPRLRDFIVQHHPQNLACLPESEWTDDVPDRIPRALAHMQGITAAMSEEARAATMEAAAPTPAFQKRFATCFLGRKG